MPVLSEPQTGYQDVDIQHRLAEFAKTSAAGKPAGNLRPNVALHAGSFLPNSPDPKQDKTWAKVQHCSALFLNQCRNWGSMNQANMKLMKSKLAAGEVRRNVSGAKDAMTAALDLKKNRAAAVQFWSNAAIGAEVSIWKHRGAEKQQTLAQTLSETVSAQQNFTSASVSSAAVPAAASLPVIHAAASCSSAAAQAVSQVEIPQVKARPAAPPAAATSWPSFASGLGRSPLPAVSPQAYSAASTAGPACKSSPAALERRVVLHVYSLGMESLLEGPKKKKTNLTVHM